MHGSHCTQVAVSLLWNDELSADTIIIEVRRIAGHGLEFSCRGLSDRLKIALLEASVAPIHTRGRYISLCSSVSFDGNLGLSPLNAEQFCEGLAPVFAMIRDRYYESRLEAAKMLCDALSPLPSMQLLKLALDTLLDSLQSLLTDPYEQIRQFGVMAIAEILQSEREQQGKEMATAISKRSAILASLLQLIDISPDENERLERNKQQRYMYPYETAQRRRTAMCCLATLSHRQPCLVLTALTIAGYPLEDMWLFAAAQLQDEHSRQWAENDVARCYHCGASSREASPRMLTTGNSSHLALF